MESSKSSTGEHKRHLVNFWQSPEQRREKYHLARSLGANTAWASRLKDWRLSKIERFYNLHPIIPSPLEHSMLHDPITE